jgi:hypothetical protein
MVRNAKMEELQQEQLEDVVACAQWAILEPTVRLL